MEISYNNIQLVAAFVCSLVTVLIPSAFFICPNAEDNEDGLKNFLQKAISEARAVTVKGLVSFGGFMLIGMLFGETFVSLSVPAIAISVGNIIGHALHLLPSSI